jgi:hypothetical protein
MPPRNWFDAPLSSRAHRTGTPANASWGRRRAISRHRDARHVEFVDDASDDGRPIFFPSVAQLAQDRYEHEQSTLERHRHSIEAQRSSDASSGASEEGHHPHSGNLPISLSYAISHHLHAGLSMQICRSIFHTSTGHPLIVPTRLRDRECR